ncbi:MAG: hypothetical protein EXR72_08125 [Myxococcales bacterium]|nr:hypothetical protein [Myxococcales bacterium]
MALLVSLCAMAVPVDPATARARDLFAHAEALYALTRYGEALAEYERAFESKPLPGFLFNIGQCHRQLDQPGRAAYFYRAYIDRQPQAKNRALVLSLISEMEERLRTERVHPPPGENEDAFSAPPDAATADGGVPPDAAMPLDLAPPARIPIADLSGLGPPPIDPPPAPFYRRWYVWTAVGTVITALAVGLGAGLAGNALPQGTWSTIDAR